ncbi:T9SS type A sorting domain-containing protein [Tenacibaculum sp. 190524A02b]|uniref:T9SS type A sorting domain-containing protein n=1 Tax=Tenacibaculum vairaonense TaxID=3137860 RepID=UPI0031FA514B
MKLNITLFMVMTLLLVSCKPSKKEALAIPKKHKKERKEENPDKYAIWTPEQAARHQKILATLSSKAQKFSRHKNGKPSYANGNLKGTWTNRGPKNMPGAFKFAEMLDDTDIIYGVTHNHYVSEFNSKSYIFKGTVYNPTKGTGGDDFVLLTANWPNRYQNLFAFKIGTTTRLVAHIENGPLYYSDNDGQTWSRSNGLPNANTSSIINRQDNHVIYVTDNRKVFKSTDHGANFSLVKDFGSKKGSFLYTPRYAVQSNASAVYLGRSGSFYKMNTQKNDFNLQGSYTNSHGSKQLSIGGDSRTLYATENKNYWVSTDEGKTWTEKFPKGNWYGDRSGKMSPGKFIAAHPETPAIVVAGYAQPVISLNSLDTSLSTTTGWGRYQNGTSLSAEAYYNRIRFNYHPDFQASHFFYNSSGNLFTARCSDGGIFVSYKEWKDFPNEGTGFDNSGYTNAHYINLNVINTINPLIYRENIFTGAKNPNHIYYSTQDQGSGSIISDTGEETLDFYQSIGGDGPPIDSYDGLHAWKWQREGKKVYGPVPVYNSSGGFQSIGKINSQFQENKSVSFPNKSLMGWVQTYIDRNKPDENLWVLAKELNRATWDGSQVTGHTVIKGTNHVAALAQAWGTPDKLFMLQDGKVYISNDRGNTFGNPITTPFAKTSEVWGRGDMGSGVVLPTNDNWILFCGPSANSVGSILSKDGGQTWKNVTGEFPSGTDAQTGGMVATPDGKFVFAGTDIGPYVFNVAEEKWYSIAEGIGFFNAMDVDYIASTNTVRFASWGSGILDFKIEENSLSTSNEEFSSHFNIYPNPAKDVLNIKMKETTASVVNISVYNLLGKEVLTQNDVSIQNTKVILNTSKLISGTYILHITSKSTQRKMTKKIIIE